MYAMICAHLDLAYAVCLVSRYMSKPEKKHWEAVKWISGEHLKWDCCMKESEEIQKY